MHGRLILIPVGLGPADSAHLHPPGALETTRRITHFVVENAKTARVDLKRLEHPTPLQQLSIAELPKHATGNSLESLLAPALQGHDIGLMSEAGCPAVADPGAALVEAAHKHGIRVVPMVGPSSLLLGLMASGLNGQSFAFHGYLPIKEAERQAALKDLEKESRKFRRTQIFIETPYRNEAMFAALLASLAPNTRLCVAREVTTAGEWIETRRVSEWKHRSPPELDRRPTVFLLLADS
ncbi:SAM-dependent methyltransferase [Niveibacterium umoris]|uniref:16S rRNA (Cytidine1402-2'-O)-methyltransferase n=1 Tax=Niveibacterium umoris TaxID=1193620 RepID=A0A840BIZ1_9RHOO|nr:SAM-dependent methyltransferase [Niveibacterium umoris]MBB4010886.1 16S rRNA (cytidine1402-2'-O)-methyltransferase [Niveibacterium umoris]